MNNIWLRGMIHPGRILPVLPLCLTVVLGGCTIRKTHRLTPTGAKILQWPVKSIKVKGVDIYRVLNILMTRGEVPSLVMEFNTDEEPWLNKRIPFKPVTLDLENATLQTVIEATLAQDPRYTYIEENGYIVIVHKRLLKNPECILNIKLDQLTITNTTQRKLFNEIKLALAQRKLQGTFASIDLMGGYDAPDLTLDIRNKTIRYILIEAAKQREQSLEINIKGNYAGIGTTSYSFFKGDTQP